MYGRKQGIITTLLPTQSVVRKEAGYFNCITSQTNEQKKGQMTSSYHFWVLGTVHTSQTNQKHTKKFVTLLLSLTDA